MNQFSNFQLLPVSDCDWLATTGSIQSHGGGSVGVGQRILLQIFVFETLPTSSRTEGLDEY